MRQEKQRWREFYREFRRVKPLYEKLEEQQKKAIEEQQKEIEEKIRQVKVRHKSVEYEELVAHQERHTRMLEELERQKQD